MDYCVGQNFCIQDREKAVLLHGILSKISMQEKEELQCQSLALYFIEKKQPTLLVPLCRIRRISRLRGFHRCRFCQTLLLRSIPK